MFIKKLITESTIKKLMPKFTNQNLNFKLKRHISVVKKANHADVKEPSGMGPRINGFIRRLICKQEPSVSILNSGILLEDIRSLAVVQERYTQMRELKLKSN